MAKYFSQQPEQKLMQIHVPEPETFFTSKVEERKKILQPLYLYTLLEYLELLEQYRQKNRIGIENYERILFNGLYRGCLKSKSKYGLKSTSSNAIFDDYLENFEQKLEKIFSVKKNIPNNADKGNSNNNTSSSGNRGYKNQLTEDIQLKGEEIDQLINMIDERLEQIQFRRMLNEGSYVQYGYLPPMQQQLISQPPEQQQKPQQKVAHPAVSPAPLIQQPKPFKRSIFDDLLLPKIETEVIDLTVPRRPSELKAEESDILRIKSLEEMQFRSELLSPTPSTLQQAPPARRLPTPMPPIAAGKPAELKQSSTCDFMKLGGHILPLPEDFNMMDRTMQNEILAKLPSDIRRKYLQMCWTIQEQNCLNVDACI